MTSLYTSFPINVLLRTCIALQTSALCRTRCNGLRTEHTNQCSQSSVTRLRPYYQQHLRNSALSANDWKYPVNRKTGIFATGILNCFVSPRNNQALSFICVGIHTHYSTKIATLVNSSFLSLDIRRIYDCWRIYGLEARIDQIRKCRRV